MHRGLTSLMLGAVLLMVPVVVACSAEELCYEDVHVVGCALPWVNTQLQWQSNPPWAGGRPCFQAWWCEADIEYAVQAFFSDDDGNWHLPAMMEVDASTYCMVLYVNESDAPTPPSTGWFLDTWFGVLCDGAPGPTVRLSGGGPCGEPPEESAPPAAALLPAGAAGLLDRGWAEGEEPPVVGEMTVSAIYEAGELISGCCNTTGDVSHLTLTWYAVTIGEEYDVREAIDSKIVRAGDAGFFFEINTQGWMPGFYDLRLGIPFEDAVWVRVEVVAAE